MASFLLAYSTSESLYGIRNAWHNGKQFTAKAEPNTIPSLPFLPLLPVIDAVARNSLAVAVCYTLLPKSATVPPLVIRSNSKAYTAHRVNAVSLSFPVGDTT